MRAILKLEEANHKMQLINIIQSNRVTYIIQKANIIEPNEKYTPLYKDMIDVFKKCEEFVFGKGEDPENYRQTFIKKYFKV